VYHKFVYSSEGDAKPDKGDKDKAYENEEEEDDIDDDERFY
jgi:hypothetical protein